MGFGCLFLFNTQCLKSVQKVAIIYYGRAIADLLTKTSALFLQLDATASILARVTPWAVSSGLLGGVLEAYMEKSTMLLAPTQKPNNWSTV